MAEDRTATKDREPRVDQWLVGPLQEAQAMATKGAEWWLQMTRPFIPALGKDGPSGQLMDLVDRSFDSMGQVLEIQREFIKAILGMLPHVEQSQPRMSAKASAS